MPVTSNPIIPKAAQRWGGENLFHHIPAWYGWGGRATIADRDPHYDPITSEVVDKLLTLDSKGLYVIRAEVGRPDLMSNAIYGSTNYWMFLMMYNRLHDPAELVAGLEILHPTLSEIETVILLSQKFDLTPEQQKVISVELEQKYDGSETYVSDDDHDPSEAHFSDVAAHLNTKVNLSGDPET